MRIYRQIFVTFCLAFGLLWQPNADAAEAKPKKKTVAQKAPMTADQIIKAMDRNMVYGSRRTIAIMKIHKRGRTRVKKMKSYSKGQDTSYSEFLSPARDKGVKYLKIGSNLWMYLPSAEKVVKISGHMLRQSMMGSDFSYEDMLESQAMRTHYKSRVEKSETCGKYQCYVIELKQRKPGQTYPKRRFWVTKKNFVPMRSEMYAASGRLLKVMTFSAIKVYDGRYYPTKMRMMNKLKRGTWTEIVMSDIAFKVKLPGQIFSLRNLQRE